MIQHVIIGILILGAIAYLCRLVYHQFTKADTCGSGCSKCSAIDFNKIEKDFLKKTSDPT